MTYATQAVIVGRRPLVVVEIDLDFCGLTYGVAPCTANNGTGNECYNTRSTCQDAANYDSGGAPTKKTYRFVEQRADLPVGEDWFPSLLSVSETPQEIGVGKGIGRRQSGIVQLQDFPHHDRGVDPYVGDRASVQGHFFLKLIARNTYYVGRPLRVLRGYVGKAFSWSDFTTHHYVIDRIDGPDRDGRVSVVAKDILKLADNKRAKAPAPSTGTLASGITDTDTSLTVVSGEGAQYGSSGHVRIGSEIIQFSGRSTDTLTGLTRATWGTPAASHSADDAVQSCLHYSASNVRDIIDDLLTTYASIPSSYINATDWDAEKTRWLSTFDLTALISKPEGVSKLLDELCEQCMLSLWWDDADQEVKLRAVMPPTDAVATLTRDNVIADSVRVQHLQSERLSRVFVNWDKINHAGDDKPENYAKTTGGIDSDAESADQYGDERSKIINSRWFTGVSSGVPVAVVGRTLSRYRNYPIAVDVDVDAAQAAGVAMGGYVRLTTEQIVDVTGTPKQTLFQIISQREIDPGHAWRYKLLESHFTSRYGFVAPNGTPNYLSATDDQKSSYAFICATGGLMSNGDDPYLVI